MKLTGSLLIFLLLLPPKLAFSGGQPDVVKAVDTKHVVLIILDVVCRDRLILEYDDILFEAREAAFAERLTKVNTSEFLARHWYVREFETQEG